MSTVTQIKETLKGNKIGKGTKVTTCSNCVTIYYPIHKTIFLGSQYLNEISSIKSLYSNSINKETSVVFNKVNNKGCIQIYII